jgi:hypothetical protein
MEEDLSKEADNEIENVIKSRNQNLYYIWWVEFRDQCLWRYTAMYIVTLTFSYLIFSRDLLLKEPELPLQSGKSNVRRVTHKRSNESIRKLAAEKCLLRLFETYILYVDSTAEQEVTKDMREVLKTKFVYHFECHQQPLIQNLLQ